MFFWAAAAAAARAEPLSGRVTDAATSAGLANATVTVVELSRATSTNATGGYDFGDLPGGVYSLRVDAAGYQPQTKSIALSDAAAPQSPRNLRRR